MKQLNSILFTKFFTWFPSYIAVQTYAQGLEIFIYTKGQLLYGMRNG